ncbi:large conductance mechanosensitive channel protein MscL [Actinocorallia lasiicapitis]
MDGFKKFLFRGNLMDLAIAVVIGAAFASLITSFTGAFINPLIALIGGEPNLDDMKFTIGKTVFPYGTFLTELLNFLIIAAVLYFLVVRPITKMMRRMGLDRPIPPAKDCPECRSEIPETAARCKYCTATQHDPRVVTPTT